jgi:hypothetical protein
MASAAEIAAANSAPRKWLGLQKAMHSSDRAAIIPVAGVHNPTTKNSPAAAASQGGTCWGKDMARVEMSHRL